MVLGCYEDHMASRATHSQCLAGLVYWIGPSGLVYLNLLKFAALCDGEYIDYYMFISFFLCWLSIFGVGL